MKFGLLPIVEQGGIVRLNFILDEKLFMSEAVVQALHTWIKQFYQEGTSKTVGENIAPLMLYFLANSIQLEDVKNLEIEAATYLLEGLTKCSVEEFIKPFDMMLQQERFKHLSSGL